MSGRPNPPDRSDSQVPPVMRRSNEVPVTPGIGSGQQVASPTSEVGEGDYFGGPGSEPSYFSEADRKLSAAAEAASTPQADAESAAARSVLGDKDGLRRTSTVGSDAGGPGVRLGSGRRESVVGARSTNMDLHLSGNIISATITVPYALKYRKGKDWVSSIGPLFGTQDRRSYEWVSRSIPSKGTPLSSAIRLIEFVCCWEWSWGPCHLSGAAGWYNSFGILFGVMPGAVLS